MWHMLCNWNVPTVICTHLISMESYANLINIGDMNEENPNPFHTRTTKSKIKLPCPEQHHSEAQWGRGNQYLKFCVRVCLLVEHWLLQRHFPLRESHQWVASSYSAQWQSHRLKLMRHGWWHPSTITMITSRKQSLPHKCNMITLYLISKGQSKDLKIVQFNVLDLGLKDPCVPVYTYVKKLK